MARANVVEMTILLEDNASTLSSISVRMGSTKPISADLIAVMDQDKIQNRLGKYVTKHSKLFEDRTAYMSAAASKRLADKKGRSFEAFYPAARALRVLQAWPESESSRSPSSARA